MTKLQNVAKGIATVSVAAIGVSPMALARENISSVDELSARSIWSAGRRPVRARRARSPTTTSAADTIASIHRRDWSSSAVSRKIPRTNGMLNLVRVLKLCLAVLLVLIHGARASAGESKAGDELFADGAITHLRLEVPAPAMEILRSYAFRRDARQEERESARCTVREGTNVWNNVAIHLKGSLGSFRAVDDAPSFTLNFSKRVSRQRFHGLEKISLNTSVQDLTRVSEKVVANFTRGAESRCRAPAMPPRN
jgi:hypothetical protein